MFAILLSDKMDPFYQNISSFPTAIFTFFLLLCVFFWAVAVLGLVDVSFLDVAEIDGGMLDLDGDGATIPDGIAGIILKLGLNGVPVTIVISFISLFAWFISYYLVYFIEPLVPVDLAMFVIDIGIFLVSLFLAVFVTAQVIKPLRKLFKNMQKHTSKVILGQTVIVRTSRVDSGFGEATLEDGGAGLILKVRSDEGVTFEKGDELVLFEYNKAENIYRVISKEAFLKL